MINKNKAKYKKSLNRSTRGSTLIEASFAIFLGLIILLCVFETLRYLYIKVLLERAAQRGVSIGAWVPQLDEGSYALRSRAANRMASEVVRYIEGAGLAHLFQNQGKTSNNTTYGNTGTISNSTLPNNSQLKRGATLFTLSSQGAYLKDTHRQILDDFNGPIMVALPQDDISYSSAMKTEPFAVLIVLDLNPLTPFMPPIRIRAEAWGYREPSPGANEFAPVGCNENPDLCDCLDTQRDPNSGLCICSDPTDPLCNKVPPSCTHQVGSICSQNGNWGIIDANCNCTCPPYSTGDITSGCTCDNKHQSDGSGKCICEEEANNANIRSDCNAIGGYFNQSTCQCDCFNGANLENGSCACPSSYVERKKDGSPYLYCCPISGLCSQAQKDLGMTDDFGDGSCRCGCPPGTPIIDTVTGKCVSEEECGSECG